jgi:ABC-type multidrug transport system fused ATPase/permease subunit
MPHPQVDAAWFRSQIGVVSQEPRLFGMDVASNVAYGCPGEVSQEDVEEACRAANAHDFIMALPQVGG